MLATLFAEAGDGLRALCGLALMTKSSGESRIIIRLLACHPRLANAIYHWGASPSSTTRSAGQDTALLLLHAKGHSHGRALRSVADRLLGVACAMLKAGTLFDLVRQGKIPRNLSKPAADWDMHDKSSTVRGLPNIMKYKGK